MNNVEAKRVSQSGDAPGARGLNASRAGAVASATRRANRASRTAAALTLQAITLRHHRFRQAATAVVSELAVRLECERVSIGFRWRGRTRIEAVSNSADIGSRQNMVRLIGEAVDEAIDQRALIVYPLPAGSSPTVTVAHARLAQGNGVGSILCVPIVTDGRAVGALLFERPVAFDRQSIELAKDAAAFAGPVLELKHQQDLPLFYRLRNAIKPRNKSIEQLNSRSNRVVAIAVAGLVGLALLWPVTYRVVAPARVEGEGQRIIAAPVDGFVQSVALRPGASVRQGQVIATLDDHDLTVEREKRVAESAQLDKQYRDALTGNDAAQIVIARSKLEQAQVQLGLVERQLARTQLRAPIDGVLISGDLSQSIGVPVKRGQELLTVSPVQSFRIIADVDEQDIDALQVGQRGQVMFASGGNGHVAIAVTRIAPVAVSRDGSNVFEVDTSVAQGDVALRHGLRGIARVEIETRSLGWVWWHRLSQKVRRLSWRLLG